MSRSRLAKTILGAAALTLCAAGISSDAQAGACKKIGKGKTPCVVTKDLKDNAVTSAKIADGTITTTDLVPGLLDSVANDSVGTAQVIDGSLTGSDVAIGTLTGANVANGSLTGIQVMDGSLLSSDIFDGPRLSSAFNGGAILSQDINNPTVVMSVTLNAPASGTALVTASGWVQFGDPGETIGCGLKLPTEDFASSYTFAGGTSVIIPVDRTAPLAVVQGDNVLQLACYKIGAVAVNISNVWLTAFYVPPSGGPPL